MKLSKKTRYSLAVLARYLLFFVSSSFIVTCCIILFLNTLSIEPDESLVREKGWYTFLNIIFISFIFTLINMLYRKFAVELPVKRISEASEKIMAGDFSVRIKPLYGSESVNEFDTIIKSINKMTEELAGVETLRTDFIANASHELKTPLSVMQNYGTLLQAPDLSYDKRIEYAKAITDSSRRLAALITNILKLNRLENQQIYPNKRAYNLGEQIAECLLLFENVWEKKRLEIETEIDDDIIINADYELLSLVWNNLFSNAMKFTPENGRISVRLKKEGNCAVVSVSDTGCGMSTEVGKHIFEKFYQGDRSHASEGNGLGLALVKRVIDIVDGEISVQSELGTGSAFFVKLML